MSQYGFSWPEKLDCHNLPESSAKSGKLCMDPKEPPTDTGANGDMYNPFMMMNTMDKELDGSDLFWATGKPHIVKKVKSKTTVQYDSLQDLYDDDVRGDDYDDFYIEDPCPCR